MPRAELMKRAINFYLGKNRATGVVDRRPVPQLRFPIDIELEKQWREKQQELRRKYAKEASEERG